MKIYNLQNINIDLEELKQQCNSLYSKENKNQVSSWNYNELDLYFKNLVSTFQNYFNLDSKKIFFEKIENRKKFKKNLR